MPKEEPLPDAGGRPEGDWAEAGRYASAEAGFEHGLVVLAMGREYWLREEGAEDYRLLVPAEAAEAARGQLELFDRESAGWPPAPAGAASSERGEQAAKRWRGALFLALLWAWAEMAVFAAQQRWPGLTEAAAMDARGVFGRGEWWRPATALFLHADAAHLFSNLAGGVFLFATVVSAWGKRRGVALLGLSAIVANLLVAAVYYPAEYFSLGASTAVFAALGLLTGRALRAVVAGARSWRAWLAPAGAGLTLLMLYGAGEGRVDVPAHAAGFAAGLAVGVVFAKRRS